MGNPQTVIYDGVGYSYVGVMGSHAWEGGPVHGDDYTREEFKKNLKEMKLERFGRIQAEEFLFMEGI